MSERAEKAVQAFEKDAFGFMDVERQELVTIIDAALVEEREQAIKEMREHYNIVDRVTERVMAKIEERLKTCPNCAGRREAAVRRAEKKRKEKADGVVDFMSAAYWARAKAWQKQKGWPRSVLWLWGFGIVAVLVVRFCVKG